MSSAFEHYKDITSHSTVQDLTQSVMLQFMYCPTTLLAGTHAKHRPGLVRRDRCGGLGFQGSSINVAVVLLASTGLLIKCTYTYNKQR